MIDELRRTYKLAALLKFSGMPRSTFYYYLKQMEQPDKYAEEKALIQQIFCEHKG